MSCWQNIAHNTLPYKFARMLLLPPDAPGFQQPLDRFLLLGMVSSMTTSSSGGSFHSLGRGGFGGPSGINASAFGRGFPRLRARHRSFEQNQFPPFRCPGSKYIAAPHRLHCFPRLMVNDLLTSHKPQRVNVRLGLD